VRRFLKTLRLARVASSALRRHDVLTLGALAVDAGIALGNMLPRPNPQVGFIYCFSQPNAVGVKIGRTNNVERRRRELRETGHAFSFVTEAFFAVPDAIDAERRVHAALAAYRMGDPHETSGVMPEWFCLDVTEAVKIIAETLDATPDSYYYRRRQA
jgi:hypothetical protein